ncbi:hypothetical protein [Terribacillus sp. FSL K6-0262]|uniref:hypothetical protein n=1 Tax=Terribacillus TaxID=459532 RepID=UPI0030ECB5B9
MKTDGGIDGGIRKGPHDFPHGTRIQIELEDLDKAIQAAKAEGQLSFWFFLSCLFGRPGRNRHWIGTVWLQ